MKTMIIYYSRNGENYFNGNYKYIEKGNTKVVAEQIQELTNGDLFEIKQVTPYSDQYAECVKQAVADKKAKKMVEIVSFPEISEYDELYVGFPNYCGSMPQAMFTLFNNIDTTNKIIKPFITNEGSGFGNSLSDLKTLCPQSIIKEGLAIRGSKANDCLKEIKDWISK